MRWRETFPIGAADKSAAVFGARSSVEKFKCP